MIHRGARTQGVAFPHHCRASTNTVFLPVSVSAQDGIFAISQAHTSSDPSVSSLTKVALSANVGLVEYRPFLNSEGDFFLQSSVFFG